LSHGYLMVCMLRNPFSVINSMRVLALNTIRGQDGWAVCNLGDMCELWNNSIEFLAKHVDDRRVLILDHYRMVNNLSVEHARVTRFFSLESFNPDYELGDRDPQATITREVYEYISRHCYIREYMRIFEAIYSCSVDLDYLSGRHMADAASIAKLMA